MTDKNYMLLMSERRAKLNDPLLRNARFNTIRVSLSRGNQTEDRELVSGLQGLGAVVMLRLDFWEEYISRLTGVTGALPNGERVRAEA